MGFSDRITKLFNNERFLFIILLSAQILYYFGVLAQHRLSIGHDGFLYFSMQYYFFNNVVNTYEMAQWMPFMSHGTVSSWVYAANSGLTQNALCLIAPLLKSVNFYYIFHAGIFFDELLLLVGCWLWGRKILKYPLAVFFLTSTVVASAVWWTQPWFNFHLYYSLPLTFYFFHRLIDTKKLRYLFLAGNLMIMGNTYYFLPFVAFVAFLYLMSYATLNWRVVSGSLSGLPKFRSVLVVALLLVFGFICYKTITHGTNEIITYRYDRTPDNKVPVAYFMNDGGSANWNKWKELYLGFSPELDYTVYAGLFMMPMLVGMLCFYRRKDCLPVLFTALILLDFTNCGLTARLSYHLWPMMSYFNHIALAVPVVKLFLCVLAAFAFEFFVCEQTLIQKSFQEYLAVMAFFFVITVALHAAIDQNSLGQMVVEITQRGLQRLFEFQDYYKGSVFPHLQVVLVLSVILAAMWLAWVFVKDPKQRGWVLLGLVAVHVTDVYVYKCYETRVRSFDVSPFMSDLKFTPMPFAHRRSVDPWAAHPRAGMINGMPLNRLLYWTNDSFLFRDVLAHESRTDYWLKPFDGFMRYFWDEDKNSLLYRPANLNYLKHVNFPSHKSKAMQWAGFSQDKIQFFPSLPQFGQEDTRMPLQYEIDGFSANHLSLSLPDARHPAGWLYYADVWHPSWKALVDGKAVTVHQAVIAYKAIEVPKGAKQIHFNFYDPCMAMFQWFFSLNAVVWVVLTLYLMGLCALPRKFPTLNI